MVVVICLVILITALMLYLHQVYSSLKKQGVKHFKPVPLFGNMFQELTRQIHIAEYLDDLYTSFPDERFVGKYEFLQYILVIKDLELVKKIVVKDFENFINRRILVDETVEPLIGRSLFSLTGQEWKDMRIALSPAFTSSKMRQMVPFMIEVSNQMMTSLKRQIEESCSDYIVVDSKDLLTRYSNDVIASCAFGMKVDSHNNRDNEFYQVGNEAANFGFKALLIFIGYATFPSILKILNIKLFTDNTRNFFRSIIIGTMKERQQKNIVRPDMIHLLMEAKKGKLTIDEKTNEANTGFATVEESDIRKANIKTAWLDDDLTAQAMFFFAAGFESASSSMIFLLYELAVNPDVQERLAQEIKEHDAKNNNKFDFVSIQSLTYLDMVVSEALRRWPPVVALNRVCNNNYNIGKPNLNAEKDFIVRKGEVVLIPTWPIHHDPKYYPNPYKFDPERFSEQNKHKIKPYTYMPFGLGPRSCIGSRFALCEIKVMVYHLIRSMELSPCESTPIPPELSRDTFSLKIRGGHNLRFRARK